MVQVYYQKIVSMNTIFCISFWLLLREMTSAKRNAHHFSKSGIAKLLIRYFFGLTIGPLYHLKTESTGNVNCSISWFSKEAFSKEANVFEKLRFTLIEGVLLKVFLLRKKLLYLLEGLDLGSFQNYITQNYLLGTELGGTLTSTLVQEEHLLLRSSHCFPFSRIC